MRNILLSILSALTLSIVITMVFNVSKFYKTLVDSGLEKTHKLAVTVNANLNLLMVLRSPDTN